MKLTFQTTLDFGVLGEQEVEIEGNFAPATPDVWYLSNGDPGYPGDPAEFYATSFKLVLPEEIRSRYKLGPRFELPVEMVTLLSDEAFEKLRTQGLETGEEQYREQSQDYDDTRSEAR